MFFIMFYANKVNLPSMIKFYIDPGIGSILAQIVIGGILSVVFFFKGLGKKIKSMYKKKNTDDGE